MATEITEVGEGTSSVKIEPKVEKIDVAETTQAKTEFTEVEREAMEQGWDPDFDGDNKRSAREFLDRGELLGKIKSQSSEMKKMNETLQNLSKHNQNVYKAGYERALVDLRAQKAQAVTNGDGARVVQLDDAIDQTRSAIAAIAQHGQTQATAPKPDPAVFEEFRQNNKWYDKDEDMQAWAHGLAINYAKSHADASEKDVYDHIAAKARIKYPDQYRKGPPNPDGEGRSRGTNSGNKDSGSKAFDALMDTLPENEARVAKDFVKRGLMTKERYVEDYNSLGRN